MDDRPSIERVILDHLISGRMQLDFARGLFRQKDLFEAKADSYRNSFPGKALAMVDDRLIFAASYSELMRRLQTEFAGKPFYIGEFGVKSPVT